MKDINVDNITPLYKSIITEIGEDIDREGLLKTPERAGFKFCGELKNCEKR